MPLPTIAKHIRGRGFDHMALIAKKMNGRYAPVLRRRKDTVQVGAEREQRIAQAKEAYFARGVDVEAKYLLIDDVWTTGSSMKAALAEMQKAGARDISVMIIAKSD